MTRKTQGLRGFKNEASNRGLIKWTSEEILKIYQEYIKEHGKFPSSSEIDNNILLPKSTAIKGHFGCNIGEFYLKYFSEYPTDLRIKPSKKYSSEEIVSKFKEEYIRLGYPSREKYLESTTLKVNIKVIIREAGATSWNDLLIKLSLPLREKGKRWNRYTLYEVYREYVEKTGYFPSSNKVKSIKSLPSYKTILRHYDSVEDFYNEYFSDYKWETYKFNYKANDEWLKQFRDSYVKLGYPTKNEYNHKREEYTPDADQLIKMAGCKYWYELLSKLEINTCGKSYTKWNEESIIESYRNFIEINKRFPCKEEIDNNIELAGYHQIKYWFKCDISEFKRRYFPDYYEYSFDDYINNKEEWIIDFINQYSMLKKKITLREYDELKRDNTPTSKQLKRLANVNTWAELIKKYNLDIDERKNISVRYDTIEFDKELAEYIESTLNKIMLDLEE